MTIVLPFCFAKASISHTSINEESLDTGSEEIPDGEMTCQENTPFTLVLKHQGEKVQIDRYLCRISRNQGKAHVCSIITKHNAPSQILLKRCKEET